MLIEKRNPDLVYPRAIKDEKTRLVLDWLLEFRFSSIEILSKRIGSTPMNSNRFFNVLLKDGVIQPFCNVHTKNERYIMITTTGKSYLEGWGRNVDKAETRVQNLGRYATIIHDIAVQKAIVKRLDKFEEVIWDKHINLPEHQDKPDALLKSIKGYWVALEYERWRKDKKRIYISFMNHVKGLKDKHYKGVYYLFDQKTDVAYYQHLFEETSWPCYKRTPKSGKVLSLGKCFEPGAIQNLDKCFVFSHDPVLQNNKRTETVYD